MTALRNARDAMGMATALVILAGTLTIVATAAIVIHAGLAAAGVVVTSNTKRKNKR